MKYRIIARCALTLPAALLFYSHTALSAVDADAAEALAKKEGCFKCHAIDKKKEADSLQTIAGKLKGKPGADEEIYKHLTTGPKVKFADGTEDNHKVLKTKDKAAIDNMIAWILSQAK